MKTERITDGRGGRDARTIVVAGGIVLALAFGVRAVFGGIVEPLSDELFGGRIEIFSLSIALQNLVWGLAQVPSVPPEVPGISPVTTRFPASTWGKPPVAASWTPSGPPKSC